MLSLNGALVVWYILLGSVLIDLHGGNNGSRWVCMSCALGELVLAAVSSRGMAVIEFLGNCGHERNKRWSQAKE